MSSSTAETVANLNAARLSKTYDARRLLEDVGSLKRFGLQAQLSNLHDGSWKGIALFSSGGDMTHVHGGRRRTYEQYLPTAALEHAPYIETILDEFDGGFISVRILTLEPGGSIFAHVDEYRGLRAGVARLHVPIVTGPGIKMVIGGVLQHWQSGELWYGNFTELHDVKNEGPVTKISLVIDTYVTEKLLALFTPEYLEKYREGDPILVKPVTPVILPAPLADYVVDFVWDDVPGIRRGRRGAVRLVGNKLQVLMEEQPWAQLLPLNDHHFFLDGRAGRSLDYTYSDGKIVGLTYLDHGKNAQYPLRVLAA
jgi:hypothetical protein